MEHNKNDSLFTYIDSIETQDMFLNYKNKKFPKLNQYAELYLANLEKEKSNEEMNSNNISKDNINFNVDNINDNNSSIKGLSNDVTNNDSIINTNFQLNKIKNEHNKNESSESNNFRTINYLAIEQLKNNIQTKSKKENIISKVNSITINQDNYIIKKNFINSNEKPKKYYKKFIPTELNKIKSGLFFNFKLNKPSKVDEKYNFSNSNKTQSNLFFRKSMNELKDNHNIKMKSKFRINNDNNVIKLNKVKKIFIESSLMSNLLSSTRKNYDIKKNIISSSLTEYSQCDSSTNKNNSHKICSLILNDYWKEKEFKKRYKLAKLREEKVKKEFGQLRDKPKINRNSIRIVERLGANISTSVFERLSESCNKILFNERRISLFTKNNKNIKSFKITERRGNSKKNNKNTRINSKYKTLKQLEKDIINTKINNYVFKENKKGKQIEEIQNMLKKNYKTEKNKNKKVQKIMYRNKYDIGKFQTNRQVNKYTSKYNNAGKIENSINNKEQFNLLNDNNILFSHNSTENIINKTKINDKIQYLISNKRLKNFLNKNQSSESLKNNKTQSQRKKDENIKKQNINQKIDSKNKITKENENEKYKSEKYKKISNNKVNVTSNEPKNNMVTITNNNLENDFNINNYNMKSKNNKIMIRNNKIKNIIISMNSFNRNINKNIKNHLNISPNQNKIKRRKMDLLKVLNFSSNIRIINKNK